MSREWRCFLDDIVECCQKIQRYIDGYDLNRLLNDDRTMDAVLRNLEIIGEASGRLPDDVIAKMAQVDWRNIRGLRNVIAHGYFGIDGKIIWDIVSHNIPELLSYIEAFDRKD